MPLRALLSHARPYRFQLILLGLLAIGSALAMLVLPWLAGHMIGGIIAPDSVDMGWLAALLLLALASIALLNFVVAYVSGATSARLLADLRLRIYEHLQRMPIGFHENHRQGDTLALMTYEVARLSQFLTGTLVNIPARLLTVTGAVILMLRIDARLAVLVPLLVPAFYLILKIVGRRLRGLAQSIQKAEAEVVAIAEENLEMLPAIKAFAREEIEASRYSAQVRRAMDLTLQESRIYAVLDPLIGLIAGSAAVLLLLMASQNMQSGSMTPTELFSFLFYAALLTQPVGTLAHVYGQIQTARGTLARLQSVLEQSVEPGYLAAGHISKSRGEIIFSDVSFSYPGRDLTLRGANLEIRAGEIVALTGSNGAGKSTLVNLLLGFYEPQQGVILLDGRNIASTQVQDLRQQIGIVPQRALLFNGTIRANIAYGLEGASDTQIATAARLAQAYDFIIGLPQGFETEIGDHGVRLSGGQRQRIALARALVKNPPVLILDEATSMYDREGETAFIAACATSLKGRTVILITHRQSSLALADRILCIEGGAVHEILRFEGNQEVAGA